MNYQTGIFSQYLSDPAIAAIVDDETFIKKMLHYETALATAQASLGLIPDNAAAEIKKVLTQLPVKPSDLSGGTSQNGIPVVTLLDLAKEKLPADIRNHLHYGATSQDVLDTAQVLIFRDAIVLIEERMIRLTQQLSQLINKYGHATCMARTRGQLALPITFA